MTTSLRDAPAPGEVQDRAAAIAGLMRARLGARGADLEDTLRHSGHRLPRKVQDAAADLARWAAEAGHPALHARLDHTQIARAEALCRRHLQRIGRWSRRGEVALAALRRLAGIGLVTTALALGLALWRGLL